MDHESIVPPGLDRSGLGTPESFIARLNQRLRKIGIVVEKLAVKTRPNGGPPCFRLAETSYPDWLAQSSLTFEMPYRLSMPAEPNYCHDCTPAFKAEMVALRACIFPDVTFEQVKELGESDIAGMSRGPQIAPADYPVYDGIVNKRRG